MEFRQESNHMPQVIGVKFRTSPKVYYFGPGEHTDLETGDYVIVSTARGQEAGEVAFPPREVPTEDIRGQLKQILRPATAVDLTQMERYQQREDDVLQVCREKVAASGLSMKVVRAEHNFDGTHLTFYFTSEKRVDFRTLVKDLAHDFKTRIELRQVGVRDEVRLVGGCGLCGREHCCSSWLCEFQPISIRMAKQQNLPLSPMEISGVCGRLLCCLAYENDYYGEVKRRLPRAGKMVQTSQGPGKVIAVNVLKETLTVRLSSDKTVDVPASEIESKPKETGEPAQQKCPRKK